MRKKFVRNLEILWRTKKYDRATGKFSIDIRYRTVSEITPRTMLVEESFGLGVNQEREYVIYDNVTLQIGDHDIVYIVGESGSGKSVLLQALEKDLGPELTFNINNVTINDKLPLVDTIGKTFEQALDLLSRVGLNDAYLFIRRYSELSDGQRYRYKLAKLAESESDKQFWIADEFCGLLDRDTAKIVAFNFQKLARQMGKAIIVATTHEDLYDDLKPSVYIRKGLGKKITVQYFPNEINRVCSVTKDMTIQEGSKEDYEVLEEWHYRQAGRVPPIMKVYTLKRGEETAGVIVYSYPGVLCFGRRKAFGRALSIKEVNEKIAQISRVVLHPKYRSIGLGTRLVEETLPRIGTPYVETVAVMARYNPFFQRAGMTKIAESAPNETVTRAVEDLRKLGFNPVFMALERYNLQLLTQLTVNNIKNVRNVLLKVEAGYYKRLKGAHKAYINREEFKAFLEKADLPTFAKVLRRLAIINQSKVYLLWRNPAYLNHIETQGG